MIDFKVAFRDIMKEKGLRFVDVSDACDVEVKNIQQILRRNNPTLVTIVRLAKGVDMPAHELIKRVTE